MGKEAQGGHKIATAASLAGGASSTDNGSMAHFWALAALAGAMFLWSGAFIAMKVALVAFHPIYIVFIRMLVSALLLAPFIRGWGRKSRYAGGDWLIIALMVISEPCLFFLFEGYALLYTSASQASMVFALMPLAVAVFAWLCFKEHLGKAAWGGFFLALGGVVWLTLAGEYSESASNPLLGNSLEFCAMLLATAYTLCARRLRGYPPFFLVAMQASAGAVFFGTLVLFMPHVIPDAYPFLPLASLLTLCSITCAAYGLYNLGIARLSASRAAAWMNAIPCLTLLMGFVFLGETLSLAQYCSLLPIAAGLILSQAGKDKRPMTRPAHNDGKILPLKTG